MTMPRLSRLCRRGGRPGRADRGVAAMEFALVAPILAFLLIATVDYSMGIYMRFQLRNAGFTPGVVNVGQGFKKGAHLFKGKLGKGGFDIFSLHGRVPQKVLAVYKSL